MLIEGGNMHFTLKEKLISWDREFYVKDKSLSNAFFSKGDLLSLDNRFLIKDFTNQDVVLVKRKFAWKFWKPDYEIHRKGKLYATIKHTGYLRGKLVIHVHGTYNLEVKGDLFGRHYRFIKDGTVLATATAKWFTIARTYDIDIKEGSDAMLIIASMIAIFMLSWDYSGGK